MCQKFTSRSNLNHLTLNIRALGNLCRFKLFMPTKLFRGKGRAITVKHNHARLCISLKVGLINRKFSESIGLSWSRTLVNQQDHTQLTLCLCSPPLASLLQLFSCTHYHSSRGCHIWWWPSLRSQCCPSCGHPPCGREEEVRSTK